MSDHKLVHILNEHNIIVNTLIVENMDDFPGSIDAAIGGKIGDVILNGKVITIEPEIVKPDVPQIVTRRQARQALLLTKNAEGVSLLDLVEPAIAAIPDDLQRGLAQIEWEDATEFERNRELVIQIGTALGLDSDGLDELFIFAATL